jgi:lactate permease
MRSGIRISIPLGNPVLSTIAAAIPVCTLFYFLAVRRTAAWLAAVYSFSVGIAIALGIFHMPVHMAAGAVADGLVYGWLRIAWILVAAVFITTFRWKPSSSRSLSSPSAGSRRPAPAGAAHRLRVRRVAGRRGRRRRTRGRHRRHADRLGFPPLQTALLCLVANSAPVAFGGLGNPVRTLVAVTGLPEADFSAMIGRILGIVILILPFWLVRILCKTRETLAIWPGLVVAAVTSAGIQFLWSNYMDASLVNIMSGLGTLLVLAFLLRQGVASEGSWRYAGEAAAPVPLGRRQAQFRRVLRAWSPFLIVSALVVLWGAPPVTRVWSAPPGSRRCPVCTCW